MITGTAGAHAPEPADDGKSPGVMLRRRREQRGLSLQDVADEMHLDRWVVETIESDRFLALGAPVYARGHLRKYAQLLELVPETVLASYEALSEGVRVAPVAPPIPAAAPAPGDRRFSVWIAVAALAVSVGALAIWKVAEPPQNERTAARPAEAAPAPTAAVSEPEPTRQPEAVVEPPSVAPPRVTEAVRETARAENAVVEQAPVTAPAATIATERVDLVLDFTESSWVEVYDSAGDKLMFDIGQPGSPRKLSGSAPLTVLLGKADAVQVTADGQQVVVPRRAGRDAARFTVAADGAVR
jgi:cytoskeleton protein RodZ